MTSSENGPQTLLAVEERVSVRKHSQVTGTVHARTLSHQHEQPVEVDLSVETLEVERVPIGRFVEGPIPDRQDGDTTVISVIEEVATLEVRLKLVEEVRITRRTTSRTMTDHVTVRRQEVVIEQDPSSDTL
ncbi:DUF2382 domain-containing protein [Azospirillum sp. TSA6c]|uniref:DUF2382 domain-containing protein n=1 Tax=unclassified Azospirillum TaxID=2630922 RepID=UPI000D607721|nr:DUF2382 domain-containing protein [Azospirillum sp. TSA6c]PWC53356.1 hypothetical protein TSA6c_02485 [Azospirillum sp. TSA6c]